MKRSVQFCVTDKTACMQYCSLSGRVCVHNDMGGMKGVHATLQAREQRVHALMVWGQVAVQGGGQARWLAEITSDANMGAS